MKTAKKFNALDIVLVVLVFIICVAAVLYLNGAGNSVMASNQKTVYFTVQMKEEPANFADNIRIGDKINDSTRGYYYGTVSDVTVEPMTEPEPDLVNNAMKRSVVPDRYFVNVTIKCNGTESDTAITAEGQKITIGKELTIKGKGYAGEGFVVALRTE